MKIITMHLKNKTRSLFSVLSFSIVVGFFISVYMSIFRSPTKLFLSYKLYRLMLWSLTNLFTQVFFWVSLCVFSGYFALSLSIYFIRRFCKPIFQNALSMVFIDKSKLVRISFSTAISLIFLFYDGWLINTYLIRRFSVLTIVANTVILPITILLWLLLMQYRWENWWLLGIKIRNYSIKRLNYLAMLIIILIILFNSFLSIERKLNPPHGPNIILIGIDTLRADHLGCYGYQKKVSLNIDKFRSDGILFRNCISQAPSTLPSFASIFTSLIPSHHLASHFVKSPVVFNVMTIGELFRERNYYTISFNDGGQVAAAFCLNRGFDLYESLKTEDFNRIVAKAIQWIKRNKNKKFFLFLHTYETHTPYTPKEKFLRPLDLNYRGVLPDRIEKELLYDINNDKVAIADNDIAHIVNAYDAEIASMDEAFSSLIAFLKKENIYDDSIIILTSDHGEEFREHDKIGLHSHTLYDELIKVPLIIKLPSNLYAGQDISAMVRSIDILPTLLDLINQPKIDYFDGKSLMSLLDGVVIEADNTYAVSQQDTRAFCVASIRTLKWKWYKGKLFDLENDPREEIDVSDDNAEVVDSLENKLKEIIDSNKTLNRIAQQPKKVEISGELEERLKSLGYL